MLVQLRDATPTSCGGKAATLGVLLRAGLAVPDGFVVPFPVFHAALDGLDIASMERGAARRAIAALPLPQGLREHVAGGLAELGDVPVAVRSSAQDEDGRGASAAGQHDSFLAVHGTESVVEALRHCWASSFSDRAESYRRRNGGAGDDTQPPAMAVVIQRHLDADVSGVMFTPARPGESTLIEASWGLGPSIVGGTVAPDSLQVAPTGEVTCTIGEKPTRLDRSGSRLVSSDVPEAKRRRPALDDDTARRLAALGEQVTKLLDGPQDIEWVIVEGRTWLVQSRPVTAPPQPSPSTTRSLDPAALAGTPGSPGTATGTVRVVRGPDDFAKVRPGDILVCPFTDPAWTPLLGIAAAVVTETGGALSHAAIVAREHRIPAVLGALRAMQRLADGQRVTVDGSAGTVTAQTEGRNGRSPRPTSQ